MRPRAGDKILILKQPWLNLILSGQKKIEVRGSAFRAGKYFLGHKQIIYGQVEIGEPRAILTMDKWKELEPLHLVSLPVLPYKRTFGLPVLSVKKMSKRLLYVHPKGAVAIVKYRNM